MTWSKRDRKCEVAGQKPLVRRWARRLTGIFGLLGGMLLVDSCSVASGGYSFTGTNIDPGVKTFSIQTVQNNAPTAPSFLSQRFTEDLKDYFQRNTSLKLVPRDGDLQFEGSIIAYEYAPAAIQKVGNVDLASQNRLTVQVKMRFTNTKDPKQDSDQTYQNFRDFQSTQDISSANNDPKVRQLTNDIITDIFNKSVANW